MAETPLASLSLTHVHYVCARALLSLPAMLIELRILMIQSPTSAHGSLSYPKDYASCMPLSFGRRAKSKFS